MKGAHLRYCLSRVKNRGYGLGNEMVPWARAFLASGNAGADEQDSFGC